MGFFLKNFHEIYLLFTAVFMKKLQFVFLFCVQLFFSQINIGVKNDVFVYTNALVSNPSAFLQNSNPWEVNLVSADVFVNNNYSFISQQSLLGLSGADNLVVNSGSDQSDLPKNTIGFSDYKKFNGYFQADVLGPAVAVKFKIKEHEFAAGFYTRLRTFGSSFNLDNQYKYENFINQTAFSRVFQPFSASVATLQENNFFISKSFLQNKTSELNIGVTFKQSKVWDAAIVRENNVYNIDYNKITNTLYYENYSAEAMVTSSYNFDKKKYEPKNNGSSIGADFGLTYVDYGNYDKENGEYFQKLAFSVTDIGFIKVNGEKHLYEGSPFVINQN